MYIFYMCELAATFRKVNSLRTVIGVRSASAESTFRSSDGLKSTVWIILKCKSLHQITLLDVNSRLV
jgi:hypothetical protein